MFSCKGSLKSFKGFKSENLLQNDKNKWFGYWTKLKKKKIQITNIKNDKGDITKTIKIRELSEKSNFN